MHSGSPLAHSDQGLRKRVYIDHPQFGYGYILSEIGDTVAVTFDNGETCAFSRLLFQSGFAKIISDPSVSNPSVQKNFAPKSSKKKKQSFKMIPTNIIHAAPPNPCRFSIIQIETNQAICTNIDATRYNKPCAFCKFHQPLT